MNSAAVNTCLVFVSRKLPDGRVSITRNVFEECVERFMSNLAEKMGTETWATTDVSMMIFGASVAALANVAGISDTTDEEALLLSEAVIQRRDPMFHLARRSSL